MMDHTEWFSEDASGVFRQFTVKDRCGDTSHFVRGYHSYSEYFLLLHRRSKTPVVVLAETEIRGDFRDTFQKWHIRCSVVSIKKRVTSKYTEWSRSQHKVSRYKRSRCEDNSFISATRGKRHLERPQIQMSVDVYRDHLEGVSSVGGLSPARLWQQGAARRGALAWKLGEGTISDFLIFWNEDFAFQVACSSGWGWRRLLMCEMMVQEI